MGRRVLKQTDDCIAKGLLRKVPPSAQQARLGLKKSKELLLEAQKALKASLHNSATMAAYAAMLDATRAILAKDGWREKSHYCTTQYLWEHYENAFGQNTLELFELYRDERHRTQYSAEYYATAESSAKMVAFAANFIEKAEKIIMEQE